MNMCAYFEVSCLKGTGIDQLLIHIAKEYISRNKTNSSKIKPLETEIIKKKTEDRCC